MAPVRAEKKIDFFKIQISDFVKQSHSKGIFDLKFCLIIAKNESL